MAEVPTLALGDDVNGATTDETWLQAQAEARVLLTDAVKIDRRAMTSLVRSTTFLFTSGRAASARWLVYLYVSSMVPRNHLGSKVEPAAVQ